MADSSSNLDLVIQSQASKEVTINALADAGSPAKVYGRRQSTTSGLTWGYYGGRWGGFSIANGAQLLAASTTTYMVVLKSTGVVSFSTATTNWNNATDYARAYKIVTNATAVVSFEDHRAGAGGVMGGSGGGLSSGEISNFRAIPSVQQALTANTTTKISFGNELTDDLGEYDPATSEFTASRPGVYVFSACVYGNGGIAYLTELYVYKNGARVALLFGQEVRGDAAVMGTSPPISLVAGDKIAIYYWNHQLSQNTNALLGNTFFAGYRVK